MNKRGLIARTTAGALGGMLLIGMAGAAIADEVGDENVAVNVAIEPIEPVGALTMSVAANSTTLTEGESGDPEVRQFNGALPAVTVTDDRAEVPAGVGWYVTGQSSNFVSGANTISAGHLGWSPSLVDSEGTGDVAVGGDVDTVLDEGPNNVGLVGEELLALALDSGAAAETGSWTAGADLFLKTPVDVAPGSYSATLTLTLWEDAQ